MLRERHEVTVEAQDPQGNSSQYKLALDGRVGAAISEGPAEHVESCIYDRRSRSTGLRVVEALRVLVLKTLIEGLREVEVEVALAQQKKTRLAEF